MKYERDKEFKEIVKNAKRTAIRDGYDQIIYFDIDGEFAFTRFFQGCLSREMDRSVKILGIVSPPAWTGGRRGDAQYRDATESDRKKAFTRSAPTKFEAFYDDYNGTAESFFTRDDINEFGYDVVDELAEFFNWMYGDLKSAFDLAGIWLDGNKLEMTVTCEYGDYDADITIDMRKIRKPSDLWKYKDIMVDKFKELINDLPY